MRLLLLSPLLSPLSIVEFASSSSSHLLFTPGAGLLKSGWSPPQGQKKGTRALGHRIGSRKSLVPSRTPHPFWVVWVVFGVRLGGSSLWDPAEATRRRGPKKEAGGARRPRTSKGVPGGTSKLAGFPPPGSAAGRAPAVRVAPAAPAPPARASGRLEGRWRRRRRRQKESVSKLGGSPF